MTAPDAQVTGSPRVEIVDNAPEHRYDILVDGTRVGLLAYQDQPVDPAHPERGPVRVFVHTEIDPGAGGHGYGGQLVAGALQDARAHGLRMVPLCPFVVSYLRRHPDEYADVVASSD